MSFRPDPNGVDICNRALSLIAQEPINSLEPPQPPGKVSRACARWYKPTVARLIEMHHFGLARERVTLTEIDNDRPNEWLYKFQLPVDVAFPVTLSPLTTSTNLQYYQGLGGLLATLMGQAVFLRAGTALYSRYGGTLDYISYDITEAAFSSTFEDLVVLMLAASVCYDLTKSRTRAEDLRQQATSAINIAIAQDMNIGNPTYGNRQSESELARGSGYALPWDWWPGPRT